MAQERIKTATSLQTSHNKLLKYCGKPNLTFSDITVEFIKGFDTDMRFAGIGTTTIGIYSRNIRTLFNETIRSKIISQEFYPFGKNNYSPPTSKKTKKALKVEDVGKIFSYKPATEIEAWARDMWLFAYFGNGLNVKDIALLKHQNLQGKEIQFYGLKQK